MKHINTKIATLLHEGFSISTLEKMSNNQLNLLYNKVVKEQKGSVKMSSETPPEKIKQYTNQGLDVEIGEEEKKVGKKKEVTEKAKSKKQQQFFGIVRGMQKGDIPKKGEAGKKAKEMEPKDVKDFASTKHKGLPKKVKSKEDVKKLEEGIMKLIENHLPPHTTKGELLYAIRRNKR